MIIETNEWKLLAIVAAHVLAALLIAWLVPGRAQVWPVCVLAPLGVTSGVLHATRLLRWEILEAHKALSAAVLIVHRTRGLGLPPDEFADQIRACVTERLAGFTFRLVTVRFGMPR